MSRNRKTAKKYQNSKSNKENCKDQSSSKRGKRVEINVDDSDINAADLRGFDKRKSKVKDNDKSWYNKYPELLKNVSALNTSIATGSKLRWDSANSNGFQFSSTQQTVPGIMTLRFTDTIGAAAGNLNSPINKVATQMYAAMRRELGSTANYDPSDIMLYILAMNSAYELYTLCVKAYGVTQMASPTNYYFLQGLMNAMGIDWETISSNISDFRASINNFAIYLASFNVPAEFDYITRHVWMLQNIFTDSATNKAQMYQYTIDHYFAYTEVQEGPASLKLTPIKNTTSGLITYSDLKLAMSNILTLLQGSQDIAQMSADIGKVWKEGVMRMALIPEGYTTPIGYSAEVLSQIENATVFGQIISADITVKVELPNYTAPTITQTPTVSTNLEPTVGTGTQAIPASYIQRNYIVNFHMQEVTPEDNMVATRLMPNVASVTGNAQDGYTLAIGECGSEIITGAWITRISIDGTDTASYNSYQFLGIMAESQFQTRLFQGWGFLADYLNFDWAPVLILLKANGSSTTDWKLSRLQDLDNYGLIDRAQLANMHECALLSLFHSDHFIKPIM